MADDNAGYFARNRANLCVELSHDAAESDVGALREAQAGAYWAVRSHFTAHGDPALVVMPTGSGKTAVMSLLGLAMTKRRLMVVTPSRVIRDQVAEEFVALKVARATNAVSLGALAPNVKTAKKRVHSAIEWERLAAFDVVVAVAKCVSPKEKGVLPCPSPNLFDTVFFDEAHHLPAATWKALVEQFSGARIVAFTATPYRNDGKLIPADIVYNYPVARAIAAGIYRPVEFVPVIGTGTREEKDRRLARRAREVIEQERNASAAGAQLLVRVAYIKETEPIRRLYEEQGLHLAIVTSARSLATNREAIQKAREGGCDGLIAVGMLGEGLDLPVLRIAVMHKPHQSFPVTLQFIGRICRMSGEFGSTGRLLAIPDDVQSQTRHLYDLDANWAKLIPGLADAAVAREQERRRFVRDNWEETGLTGGEVSVHSLRPFYAVAVYQIQSEGLDITKELDFGPGKALIESFVSRNGKWRIVITQSLSRPTWTTSQAILDRTYDLHIYYRVNDLLFEATTSEDLAVQVRSAFGQEYLTQVPKDRIEQAISQRDLLAYLNLGMRRVAYAGTSVPTYKMLAGSHAEHAVRASDGQFFSVGHILSQVKEGDRKAVLGVSGEKGKIWAVNRDHLSEFTTWCQRLADTLANSSSVHLQYLTHLRQPIHVEALTAEPIAVDFGDSFFKHIEHELSLEIREACGAVERLDMSTSTIALSIIPGSWAMTSPGEFAVQISIDGHALRIRYDLRASPSYRLDPAADCAECRVRFRDRYRTLEYSLENYLALYPLPALLADGSILVGHGLFSYRSPAYELPPDITSSLDWQQMSCDIEVEDETKLDADGQEDLRERGQCSVLQAMRSVLPTLYQDATIIEDHRSGEVADFVVFQPLAANMRLHLYHCKSSSDAAPGVRTEDIQEVVIQGWKCLRWLRRADLFRHLRGRATQAKVIQGSLDNLDRIIAEASPQVCEYTVQLVQPGLDIGKSIAREDPSVRLVLLSLYDSLRSQDVELRIIGSRGQSK